MWRNAVVTIRFARTLESRIPSPESRQRGRINGRFRRPAAVFPRTTGGTRTFRRRRSIRSLTPISTSLGGPAAPILTSARLRTAFHTSASARPGPCADHLRRLRQRERSRISRGEMAIRCPTPRSRSRTSSRAAPPAEEPAAIVICSSSIATDGCSTNCSPPGGMRHGAVGSGLGAVFDLSSNTRRPEGWTSADAAGLAILPGLVRFDEVMRGAGPPCVSRDGARDQRLRLACIASRRHHRRRAADGYASPPQGVEGSLTVSGADPEHVPRDADLRPDRGRQRQRHVRHGSMDARWNNAELNPAFAALTAGDFEVIRLGWR